MPGFFFSDKSAILFTIFNHLLKSNVRLNFRIFHGFCVRDTPLGRVARDPAHLLPPTNPPGIQNLPYFIRAIYLHVWMPCNSRVATVCSVV